MCQQEGTFQGSALALQCAQFGRGGGPPESARGGASELGRQRGCGGLDAECRRDLEGLSHLWSVAGSLCEASGHRSSQRVSWHGGRILTLVGSRDTGKTGRWGRCECKRPFWELAEGERSVSVRQQCLGRVRTLYFKRRVIAVCFV